MTIFCPEPPRFPPLFKIECQKCGWRKIVMSDCIILENRCPECGHDRLLFKRCCLYDINPGKWLMDKLLKKE
jgi:DNA-directed RNA polymerase subunit RPC12/RpoP